MACKPGTQSLENSPPATTSAVLKGKRKIANRSEKKDCEILFILLC
jgi:hypothetical protein